MRKPFIIDIPKIDGGALRLTIQLHEDETIDLNSLVQAISDIEGKKEQVNIAQIKEITKYVLSLIGCMYNNKYEIPVIDTIKKYML